MHLFLSLRVEEETLKELYIFLCRCSFLVSLPLLSWSYNVAISRCRGILEISLGYFCLVTYAMYPSSLSDCHNCVLFSW
jgi:hypothetical protein